MTRRGRVTWRTRFGSVMRGLAVPAVLLCAIGSANAQTSAPVDDGRAAPKETPNTGTATTEAPKTEAPKTEAPKAERRKPRRQRSRRLKGLRPLLMDSRSEGSSSNREGGSSWTSSVTSMRSPPRTRSTPARSPRTGATAATRNLHARETRLFLDIRGPVEGKELKMYIETDFYGSSSVLRLRQAYGSYGGLLAGQTWSTFVDESNFPNTIDFESPMAFPSIRQAQLRWTRKLGANGSWSVAVEDNKSRITLPTGEPGKAGVSDAGRGREFPFRRVRAGTPSLVFSARGASGRRKATRTT